LEGKSTLVVCLSNNWRENGQCCDSSTQGISLATDGTGKIKGKNKNIVKMDLLYTYWENFLTMN